MIKLLSVTVPSNTSERTDVKERPHHINMTRLWWTKERCRHCKWFTLCNTRILLNSKECVSPYYISNSSPSWLPKTSQGMEHSAPWHRSKELEMKSMSASWTVRSSSFLTLCQLWRTWCENIARPKRHVYRNWTVWWTYIGTFISQVILISSIESLNECTTRFKVHDDGTMCPSDEWLTDVSEWDDDEDDSDEETLESLDAQTDPFSKRLQLQSQEKKTQWTRLYMISQLIKLSSTKAT